MPFIAAGCDDILAIVGLRKYITTSIIWLVFGLCSNDAEQKEKKKKTNHRFWKQ